MIGKSRIKQLALFLNIDQEFFSQLDREIQDRPGFTKWANIAVEDWRLNKIDQSNKKEVEDWFNYNDKYIFELSDFHSSKTKKKIVRQIVRILKKYSVKTYLDYGGGIGEESIAAAKAKIKSSMADLPNLTFDFAKWRAYYLKVKVDFIAIVDDQPLKKKYDAISCLEVLQHLYNPEEIAKHLVNHLKKKGILIITTRFHNPGYLMALKKNYRYDEGAELVFTGLGLKLIDKIYQYGQGEKAKYLYIYQK